MKKLHFVAHPFLKDKWGDLCTFPQSHFINILDILHVQIVILYFHHQRGQKLEDKIRFENI